MKIKAIIYMSAEECFDLFQTEEMKKEYKKDLERVNINDIYSIQNFLDDIAFDVERLNQSQCDLLGLNYDEGYYISTWNDEYLLN